MRSWMNGGVALTLALGLIGCGGDAGGKTGGKDGGKTADGKTAKPKKPAPPKIEDGAATPEELFEKMKGAAKEKSFMKVAHLIAPSDRATVCGVMTMGAGMIVGMSTMAIKDEAEREKKKQELEASMEALLSKHGVKKDDMKDADMSKPETFGAAFKDKDTLAYLGDLFAWMEKNGGEKQSMSKDFPDDAKMEELKVEGDRATAKIAGKTRAMKKEGGRWYMDMMKQ